ncbi:MAG: HD domain-containing protein [Clostridia bacterium]|nr:HD domain-containing protein [Clostridia bacterium]
MNPKELSRFRQLVRDTADHPRVQIMKTYRQHGCISTYDHCMGVARMSFRLARLLHIRTDEPSLVRGAFLHDYYLYDWHNHQHKLHGFRHPKTAMHNAIRDFNVNSLEAGIIRTHMWPFTLRALPRTREAVIVCLADKICALRETFHRSSPRAEHT